MLKKTSFEFITIFFNIKRTPIPRLKWNGWPYVDKCDLFRVDDSGVKKQLD